MSSLKKLPKGRKVEELSCEMVFEKRKVRYWSKHDVGLLSSPPGHSKVVH